MTRTCRICDLDHFLLDWVEKLIVSGYNLREVSRRLNAHGLNINYQDVQKHKRHRDSALTKRISQQMGYGKQEPTSILQKQNHLKRQCEELEGWIKAESNPPQEALNAYSSLSLKILQLERALRSIEKK